MMAKVGIVTFHNSMNHGAVLQAYGLARAIHEMGHDALIVDYLSPSQRRVFYERSLGETIGMLRYPRTFVLEWKKRRSFRGFRRDFLPLTREQYGNVEELRRDPPAVDVLVCGSDQIWNIHTGSTGGFDRAFFLDFGAPSLRRVSYAACVGDTEPFELREKADALLERFDHVSVRDAKSESAVLELTGRRPARVLDPSFLTDYSAIAARRLLKRPYCFAYVFGRTPLIERAIRLIQDEMGLPVVSLNRFSVETTVMYGAGPLEWLSLMRHADYVLTNSFHGTCFALIWQKNFVTLPVRETRQFRLDDLLETAGLETRLVLGTDQLMQAIRTPVDHSRATECIVAARDHSLAYLAQALG